MIFNNGINVCVENVDNQMNYEILVFNLADCCILMLRPINKDF